MPDKIREETDDIIILDEYLIKLYACLLVFLLFIFGSWNYICTFAYYVCSPAMVY